MSLDDFLALVGKRKSVRYFSSDPVDPAIIETLLQVARLSPSIENTQPWHFHVIKNEEMKKEIMKCSCYGNFVAGASAFIVVTCSRMAETRTASPIWNPKELEYSCVVAMESVMLAATAMDLGSCWVSLHHGPVHNLLKLKDYNIVIGGLMIGRLKKEEKGSDDVAHERRPLSEMVTYYE